jgi:diguanylate cyclase (GGDEF)-like protein
MLADRPIRVLIVDDSEDDAFLVYSELESRGARVDYRRVDNAEDTAVALQSDSWDVIICDHNMPGFDSLAALEVLKQSGKDIPFILYSGHVSDQLGISAMRDGVHDYIHKGNYAKLMPVIERELRGAAARSAARQADHRIQELANYDALSSLPNHNLFCARVSEWIRETATGGQEPLGALFYLDVDRFMRINSSFGYETGNAILRQTAQRLAACVESTDFLARLGGDEFGIFQPGLGDSAAVERFSNSLIKAFDVPFMKDRLELYLTPSIGVARLPEDGHEVYQLLMNAESAMAHTKRGGGNAFRRYSREMNSSSAERIALESELRHAVERDQLFLQYQPCVNARTGCTQSVEALVRWRHPERGVITPDRFIPIADESGLIVEIGEWVLNKACDQVRRWHELGFGELSVSVNVSAVQFAQPRLLDTVNKMLIRKGFPPHLLELEITETVLMRDAENTISMLRAFKSMGVRISADDFGTGYSSISYLKRFPIDILKIDRSFIRDITSDEDDAAIVTAIMAVAKSLRLTTIAEGVETAEQVAFLQQHQCDRFQGFLYSRPLDVLGLTEHLLAQRSAG